MSPVSASGLVHEVNGAPSVEQLKAAPGSPLNDTAALLEFERNAGTPDSTGASAVVSTVHVFVASVLVLPAWSVCLTARV
jgi:hypothetical protein